MNSMIAVRLEGRLGNQMFQYAFVYSTAKKLNAKYYFDESLEDFKLTSYFELSKSEYYKFNLKIFRFKGFKNLFTYHLKRLYYNLLIKVFNLKLVKINNNGSPIDELKKIKKNSIFIGFFQSQLYFNSEEENVKNLYRIKSEHFEIFESITKELPFDKEIISIHIRQGDYKTLGLALPMNYYHEAIEHINAPNAFYIFLSDEPQNISSEFEYITNKYISNNTEIIDLQFIMNADICILSNSSFSWWGAYLNKRNPKVLVPKYWVGKNEEFPNSIIRDNWIRI